MERVKEKKIPRVEVVLSEDYAVQLRLEVLEMVHNAVKSVDITNTLKLKYVNQSELKKLLRIGQDVLDDLIENGLQYVRLGNKVLYDIEDVYRILESMKVWILNINLSSWITTIGKIVLSVLCL